MPGYTSQYIPIDFAIKRIAKHHFGGDKTAAWRNVQIAIDEGAITTASGNSEKDMLSYIVAGVVKSGTRRNSPERNEPPAGTWLRRELEEVYGQIFAEDGSPIDPDEVVYKSPLYQTEQDEDQLPRPSGRPSLGLEIEAAYKELRGTAEIDFDAPKKRLYEPIREKVREHKRDPSLKKGLQDEAIRKVISPLFEVDKNRHLASP